MKCELCGLESELDAAFIKQRNAIGAPQKVMCPSCWVGWNNSRRLKERNVCMNCAPPLRDYYAIYYAILSYYAIPLLYLEFLGRLSGEQFLFPFGFGQLRQIPSGPRGQAGRFGRELTEG